MMPIVELAERTPGVIFQLTAHDLKEFAHELLQGKNDALMTIDEVVELLKVSKMTLNRWHKTGFLVKLTIGAHRRYRRSDVEALILKGGKR